MSSFGKTSIWISAVAPALLGGCGFGGKKPTSQPATVPPPQVSWGQAPVVTPPPVNLPVTEGPLPLAYLVDGDSYVRVVDMTDGLELLYMPVSAKQFVAVIADQGVTVAGATVKSMRLPANHRYGIYILSRQENIMRTGQVRPVAPYSPSAVPGRQP